MPDADAIVIGAGPNGLVCANRLVDSGWDVLVLEAQPTVGGAVRSDRDVHPDFVHDTFSAFYPLSAASAAIQAFTLEEYDLRWVHAPAVLGHPRPDGSWALLHRDPEITAALLDDQRPGDGAAWLALVDQWSVIGSDVIRSLLTPFPPIRGGLGALLKLPRVGGLSFVQSMLKPATEILHPDFGGDAAPLMLGGSAFHADIPLDATGSGFMGLFLVMLGQTVGWPVPEGGAGRLAAALAARLLAKGGRIECNAEVTRIDVRAGRAVGVRCGTESFGARRAVIADVVVEHLYGGLIDWSELPSRTRTAMARFERDPATVKVDWALSGPVPWQAPPPYAPGTVHVADSVEEMIMTSGQIETGLIPSHPMLLAGQMTTTDPTRSPARTESMWAYTHVPQQVRGDAGSGVTGSWDRSDAERFADRMQDRLEARAPGFGDLILARRVLSPHDLEARDANLVGGSVNGGSAALHQQLIFRPVPGSGRATTPIQNLYLGSASAHPGGGVHGACGMNAARAALSHARVEAVRSRLRPSATRAQVQGRRTAD